MIVAIIVKCGNTITFPHFIILLIYKSLVIKEGCVTLIKDRITPNFRSTCIIQVHDEFWNVQHKFSFSKRVNLVPCSL